MTIFRVCLSAPHPLKAESILATEPMTIKTYTSHRADTSARMQLHGPDDQALPGREAREHPRWFVNALSARWVWPAVPKEHPQPGRIEACTAGVIGSEAVSMEGTVGYSRAYRSVSGTAARSAAGRVIAWDLDHRVRSELEAQA